MKKSIVTIDVDSLKVPDAALSLEDPEITPGTILKVKIDKCPKPLFFLCHRQVKDERYVFLGFSPLHPTHENNYYIDTFFIKSSFFSGMCMPGGEMITESTFRNHLLNIINHEDYYAMSNVKIDSIEQFNANPIMYKLFTSN